MRILLSCVGLAILQGTWAVEEDISSESRSFPNNYPVQQYASESQYILPRTDSTILDGPVPTLGVLLLGTLFGAGVAVFQAAEARRNLQSQADSIRTTLDTSQNSFNTLSTSISALSNTILTSSAQTSTICTVGKTIAVLPTTSLTDPWLNLAAIINGLKSAPCP